MLTATVSFAAAGAAWFVLLWLVPPPDPYRIKPPGQQVFARDGSLLRGFLSADHKWRLRTPLADISPHLANTVLAHEDRWFHAHPGINPVSVVRSAWTNLRAGRVVSGASTITMQLARLVEPRPRSVSAKLLQAFRALQYEWVYSKDEILEMYLNLAPYGGNIEGVGAASHIYFAKPPAELSVAEACLLAVLPQSPTARHPLRRPEAARQARDRLIDRLEQRGVLDSPTAHLSRQQPLPREAGTIPFAAPHFCEWVTRRCPRQANLPTTIDRDLQAGVEKLLQAHVRQLLATGITQGSVVVLDSRTGELLVLAGSASYHDSLHAGQVNGALALRSPGSTLKPFVYALAFDRGVATPATLLEDVPVQFGAYSPENYDGAYAGAVTAGQALRKSRNVPAVLLASELHRGGSFHAWLQEAGVRSLDRPAEHYGLALVLGGGDLTLLELAELYGILARQGVRLPTRLLRTEEPAPGTRVLSRAAAYLTLQELVAVERPTLDAVWRAGTNQVPIPWKTGTSYGHRDGWSVGIAGEHVVAVWIGNFDGAGAPRLSGRSAAAPLLFDLIDLLPRRSRGQWHHRPVDLGRREVCSLSGAPPSTHCPEIREAGYIPGVSPAGTCSLHRRVELDVLTGQTVCSRCRTAGQTQGKIVVWWPARLATFLAANHMSECPVPPHRPDCPEFGRGEPPAIVSPQEGMEYHLRPSVPPADQQIALVASVGQASQCVYWFIDGLLYWQGDPGESVFLAPTPGRHRVSVKDDAGRVASTVLTVVGP